MQLKLLGPGQFNRGVVLYFPIHDSRLLNSLFVSLFDQLQAQCKSKKVLKFIKMRSTYVLKPFVWFYLKPRYGCIVIPGVQINISSDLESASNTCGPKASMNGRCIRICVFPGKDRSGWLYHWNLGTLRVVFILYRSISNTRPSILYISVSVYLFDRP